MVLNDELLQKVKIKEDVDFLCVSIYQEITNEENKQIERYAKDKGLSLRMTLAGLSENQKQSLEDMRNFRREMESIPESEKEQIPQQILDRWQSEAG
jgi:methylmalonyl-CoA mutase cobalamin-binding subunit